MLDDEVDPEAYVPETGEDWPDDGLPEDPNPVRPWVEHPRDPWERQYGESSKAFACFAAYRDMGWQRSLKAVAEQMNKNPSLVARWSRRWHWVERAQAWDDEMDRQARHEAIELYRDTMRQHHQVGGLMLRVAAMRLVGDEVNGVQRIDPNKLTATEIARIVDVATRVQARAVTQPGTGEKSVEAEVDVDVRVLVASNPALAMKVREVAEMMEGLDAQVGEPAELPPT
jgi:hypothetical protein